MHTRCVFGVGVLLIHRGSAAAAKDTAGAAKAEAIVFKVDHDNYYLNAGMQSAEYMGGELASKREKKQATAWMEYGCLCALGAHGLC